MIMGMARLLGGSTPRFLVQVLSIKPYRAEALIITRGGPRKSGLGKGRGGQHNNVGTMSVEDKPEASNLAKDSSSRKGNDQVNKNTAKSSR